MAELMLGKDLEPTAIRYVLNRYQYRMTAESCRRWPGIAKWMRSSGFRLPIITDEEWLAVTKFYVKADGTLDRRYRHCISDR